MSILAAYGYDDDFWPEDAEYPEVEYRIGNDIAILYRGLNLEPGWSLGIPGPDGDTDWTWYQYYDEYGEELAPYIQEAAGDHVGRHWSFSQDAAKEFAGDCGIVLKARVSGSMEEIYREPKEEAGVYTVEDDEQEVYLRENALVDLLGASICDPAGTERYYWLDVEFPQRIEAWASSRGASSDFDGRLGRCYELAAKEVAYEGGGTLVHGTITNNLGNMRTIDHAWVERDSGMIYDAVMQREFEPSVYERIYGANPMFRYDQEEVLINLVQFEHWGPWEDVFYEDGREDEF